MAAKHDGKPYIDVDKAVQLYKDGMTQYEVADELGVSQGVIWDALDGKDVDTSYQNDPTHPPQHYFHKESDVVGTEYEKVQTRVCGSDPISVRIHRLIAVAHGMLEPSDVWGNNDIVVHHKSEHGLDNRPENLEVMKRGEHQTMHLEERYG